MAASRLDIAFVPAECPGAEATGAVQTSTLLIEELSEHHDLTVYIVSQMDANERTLPVPDRVTYVRHDDLPKLPHPDALKLQALRDERAALESHDLVHAYPPTFIPVLADLDVPTIATLNSYVGVCPKEDLLYHGRQKCSGAATAKCVGCLGVTAARRRQGVSAEVRSVYDSLGRIGLVGTARDRAADITAYHALAPHLKEDHAARGFPADAIRVIPHFFDDTFLSLSAEQPTGILGDGPVRLLYVGALHEVKGVDILVKALPALREWLDLEVHIVGAGAYETRLRQLADRLNVDDLISWMGYVDHAELPAEYEWADVFVYPGRIDEPFGRVLLEALSSQTPVVAADVGSTEFVVGDGGVRFDPGDPDALAAACCQLVENYDAHYAAIPDQLRRFDPSVVIQELLDLYTEVAGTRAPQPART